MRRALKSRNVLRLLVASAHAVLGLSYIGCRSGSEGFPIAGDQAQRELVAAFDRPLVENVITGPKETTDRIAISFTGGTADEHLTAIVFTAPSGSGALTGGTKAGHLKSPERTALIRVANVVVLYTHADGSIDRAPALRRGLERAAGGAETGKRRDKSKAVTAKIPDRASESSRPDP